MAIEKYDGSGFNYAENSNSNVTFIDYLIVTFLMALLIFGGVRAIQFLNTIDVNRPDIKA